MKSYEEINAKIRAGKAVVVTAEEVIHIAKDIGIKEAAQKIDVVTWHHVQLRRFSQFLAYQTQDQNAAGLAG